MMEKISNRKNDIVLLIGVVWMVLSIIIYYSFNSNKTESHNVLVIFCTLSYILCFWTWVKSGGYIVSLFGIFVLYAFFSNLGQSFLALFDLSDYLSIYYIYNLSTISEMLRFQLLCISALNLGCALYVGFKGQFHVFNVKLSPSSISQKKTILDYLLFFSIIWMIVYTFYQLSLRRTLTYSELYETRENVATLPYFLSVVLSLYFVFKRKYVVFITISLVWILLALFLAGTRSMGIVYFGVLVIMALLLKPELFSGKKVIIWILAAIPAFALISVVSAFRSSSIGEGALTMESGMLFSFLETISEMGLSERPAIATINYIQNGGQHMQTILYTVLHGIIPTAPLQSLMPPGSEISLSEWVTSYEDHEFSGLGYSFIAESYMNYGDLGWIFTLFYGYLITGMEVTSYRKINEGKYLFPVVVLMLLSKQIFFARANLLLIGTYYRYAIYIGIVWVIIKSTNKKINYKKI